MHQNYFLAENKNRRSYACLEIRSRSEEAINSTQNRIYSLEVFFFFTSYFIDVDTFYLFLNWFSTLASDDRKYVCCRRLYACINTRKFKGRFRRIYIIARGKKWFTWHVISITGSQREYSSKPLKHSIVKRILVFKR